MQTSKKLISILIFLAMAGCNARWATGPQIEIGNVYSISLTVDSDGEFHLSGELDIPTPLHSELVDVNWVVAFDVVLNEAQQAENTLYLLYNDDFGDILQDVYAIDRPFKLEFARNEWVRKIDYTGGGSAVVFVERFSDRSKIHFITMDSFAIAGCSSAIKCPDAATPRSLLPDDVDISDGAYHEAGIGPSSALRFVKGWCTNDESLLYQNLEHLEFVFNINGRSYTDHLEGQYRSTPTENEGEFEYCYLEGAVIQNWAHGTFDIEFGFRADAELYDGWDTYPAQDYINRYTLNVQ